MAVVSTQSLTRDYPRVRALDGLTLDLPGGAVGLLGPNGAGKSTLIKTLLGFIEPTSGSARVLDVDPVRSPIEARRRIGYMPEVESFIPGMSAVDTVYLAGRLSGMRHTAAMQRTHRVLNYVGLHEERYRNVETYSTGMKQKVKFAQAIVHHPALLLLDEPTTGLDPRAREEMLLLVRDIAHGKGIDVVLSTHILLDVETVCDHVVILQRGKRAAQGALAELIQGSEGEYEVRIRGDRAAFLKNLETHGVSAVDGDVDAVRVTRATSTDPILQAAADSGVELRALTPARGSLENVFENLGIS